MVEEKVLLQLEKEQIIEYKISNNIGNHIKVLNLGLSVISININSREMVLSYENISDYIKNDYYLGCIVGRFANRIEKGKFNLYNQNYNLIQNDNGNHLHGGGYEGKSLSHRFWHTVGGIKDNDLLFAISIDDKEDGYPSALTVYCRIEFNDSNEVIIDMRGYPDETTILNFTNHTYFNLDYGNEVFLNHKFKFYSNKHLETKDGIPTGNILYSRDAMNFSDLKHLPDEKKDYDDCFLISNNAPRYDCYEQGNSKFDLTLNSIAHIEGPVGNLDIYSTKQSFQFYTGKFLDGKKEGKNGPLSQYTGFCIEPQFNPNSPNIEKFNVGIFSSVKPYHHIILYKFSNVSETNNISNSSEV